MSGIIAAVCVCLCVWGSSARVAASGCSSAPQLSPDAGMVHLWERLGSTVNLTCSARILLDSPEPPHSLDLRARPEPWDKQCDITLQWRKDGQTLENQSHSLHNSSSWTPGKEQLLITSVLLVFLRGAEDFGVYSCFVRNTSVFFNLQEASFPSHTSAVSAALVLLLLLAAAALIYSRCHLNIRLCYKNSYGDLELNDGKLYDACISYVSNEHDRKFVNFILRPQLESRNGHKLLLTDNDILPGAEPSAELLVGLSRSRRLIIVLSHAYLQQEWCCNNFRPGLLRLLELCRHPILIMLEGQWKQLQPEIRQQLSEHQHTLTILTWKHNSVTPSSVFWKELDLAMPRRVVFHTESAGDPQTLLQNDKDPMLTLDPDYTDDCSDTDPAGDLGIRLPVYKALVCRAPVLPPAVSLTVAAAPSAAATELQPSDVDVSDLGSRTYGARSDFYCLVTDDGM